MPIMIVRTASTHCLRRDVGIWSNLQVFDRADSMILRTSSSVNCLNSRRVKSKADSFNSALKSGRRIGPRRGSFDSYMTRVIRSLYFTFISAQPRATFKGAAGRIWPAGCHLRRPALLCPSAGLKNLKLF